MPKIKTICQKCGKPAVDTYCRAHSDKYRVYHKEYMKKYRLKKELELGRVYSIDTPQPTNILPAAKS